MKIINILILILLLGCNKNDEAAEPAPEENLGPIVRVMTYNIHIGNPPSEPGGVVDLEGIARVIKASNPDLVALQEVDVFTERSGVTLHQAKRLAELTGMNYFFTKAIDVQGGMYGDAVLSRFPILESFRYELPVTEKLGGEMRSVAMIRVELSDEQQILFASTHLDHYGPENNRLLQAQELIKIVDQLEYPLIIAGDFNAVPTSQTISILTEGGLVLGCKSSCQPTFSAQNPTRTIDYIMFKPSAQFDVLGYVTVNETYASDHLPVVAEIQVNQ